MRRINSSRNLYARRVIDRSARKTHNRRSKQFKSVIERDFAAMAIVWRMLKEGTARAFGEIGRQY